MEITNSLLRLALLFTPGLFATLIYRRLMAIYAQGAKSNWKTLPGYATVWR